MTVRNKWLPAALRAQQALTLDHALRHQQAGEALELSRLTHAGAARALEAGTVQWLQQRRCSPSDLEWDALHLGFHRFLAGRTEAAVKAHETCRSRHDDATRGLQRSHVVLQSLQRLAERALEAQRREANAREAHLQQEAWLLARISALCALDTTDATRDDSRPRDVEMSKLPVYVKPHSGD